MTKSTRLLLSSAVLLACEGDPIDPSNPSTPIEGALIWFTYPAGVFGTGAQTATSASDGQYQLIFDAGVRIATCDGMALDAEASGFGRSDLRSVACTAAPQVQDFALTPTAP